MLSRCLGHLKKKGAVKLIWIISNGTKAPHYDKSIDNENVVELSYKQWRNVFSSQETIKTLMNWIHLNVLVSDSPPEPIDRPFTLREVQRVFYNEIDKLYEMYLTSTDKSMTKEQFKKLVVLCCGSGKTFLAYSIFTKSYRGNLLVVYVLELEKIKYVVLTQIRTSQVRAITTLDMATLSNLLVVFDTRRTPYVEFQIQTTNPCWFRCCT